MSHPSKDDKEPTAQSLVSIELRLLAGLEVKRRQLQRELAEVIEQYQELTLLPFSSIDAKETEA